jgi:hypothetical protein
MPASVTDTGAAHELAGEAKAAAEQATEQAKRTAEQAKRTAAEHFDQQKSSATQQIRSFARALRSTADQWEPEQMAIADYARRAADGVERFGDAVERKNLGELMKDVERICRERPLAVGAAAVFVGFLGTRLARAAAGGPAGEQESEAQLELRAQTYERTELGGEPVEGGV